MEDDCSWIRRTKFSHRFDSRLTSVPLTSQDYQEVQRSSRMSSPIGRSPLVNEQRSSTPPYPRRIQSEDQGILGKFFKKSSSQPNSSHLLQSASMKVSDKSSKSERKEAKNIEHRGVSSATVVDGSSLDLSQMYLGAKFSHGAHSKIYHGRYNEEAVAVKMITVPEDDQGRPLAASLLKQVNSEVSLLSRLQHTNIIKFVGSCRQPPVYFVVTEYLNEGSLGQYLKKLEGKSLSFEKLVALSLDIARGMEYIHSQGVIHRDLKPENVLIDKDFRLKIADFGIACEEGHCDSLTGTYRYMAPEWIKHKAKDLEKKSFGRKVDVYSFGLILWELVAGKIPFEELNPVQVAVAVSDKNMRPVIPKDCPPEMQALIEQCWSKQPEKRPEFWQVVKVLEQFQSSLARDGTLTLAQNLTTFQDHKKGRLHWIQMLGQQFIHA